MTNKIIDVNPHTEPETINMGSLPHGSPFVSNHTGFSNAIINDSVFIKSDDDYDERGYRCIRLSNGKVSYWQHDTQVIVIEMEIHCREVVK